MLELSVWALDGHERLLSSASVACDGIMHTPSTDPSTNHPQITVTPRMRCLHLVQPFAHIDPGKVGFGEELTFAPIRTSASTQYRRSIDAVSSLLGFDMSPATGRPRILSIGPSPFSKTKRERSNPNNPVILGLFSQIYGGS